MMSFRSPAEMTSVAVAVNGSLGGTGGNGSIRAIKWAVENLLPKAHHFVLIHVVPTITSIPSPYKHDANINLGIFGIAVSVLLTALQLKYQATTLSPFQDHPKAMAIAIASLLILCFGCDVEQYLASIISTHRRFNATMLILLQHGLRLLGYVSLASLASVIFSPSTTSTPSLIVFLIFVLFFSARFVLNNWIRKRSLHGNSTGAYIHTLPVYHIASAN